MKEDWLDKNMKEGLKNYASPLDEGNAWERLQQVRNQKKRKKRGIFWLWFLGIGMLISVMAAINWYSTTNTSNQDQVKLEPTQELAGIKADTTPQDKILADKEQYRTDIQHSSIDQKKPSPNNPAIENNTSRIKAGISAFSSKKNPRISKTLISEIPTIKKSEKPKNPLPPVVDSSQVSSNLQKELALAPIPILPPQPIPLPDKKISLKRLKLPVKENNKWNLVINSSYGLLDVHRNNKLLSDSLFALSQTLEDPLDYWQVGISLQRNIGTQFFLEAGINWQTSVSEFATDYSTDSTFNQRVSDAFIIERQNGTRDTRAGITTINRNYSGRIKAYNRLHQLSLPLLLGYRHSINDKWAFELAAGPVIRLWQHTTGYQLNQTLTLPPYEEIPANLDKGIGVNQITSRLAITRSLGSLFSIRGGFSGQWQWSNRLSNTATYQERRNLVGAEVGIIWHLKSKP